MTEIRQLIGYCPQHDLLFNELTVREHLEFYGQIRGLVGNPLESEVHRLLKAVLLEDKIDTRAQHLSGGMKRKLSLAISLIGDPKVLFLDEPTAGMDPYSRRQVWDLLIKEKVNKTIILTTHCIQSENWKVQQNSIPESFLLCARTEFVEKTRNNRTIQEILLWWNWLIIVHFFDFSSNNSFLAQWGKLSVFLIVQERNCLRKIRPWDTYQWDMDEADYLADRITIMSKGTLQCMGTSLFLKKRFGVHYYLAVEKLHDKTADSLHDLVKSVLNRLRITFLENSWVRIGQWIWNRLELRTSPHRSREVRRSIQRNGSEEWSVERQELRSLHDNIGRSVFEVVGKGIKGSSSFER